MIIRRSSRNFNSSFTKSYEMLKDSQSLTDSGRGRLFSDFQSRVGPRCRDSYAGCWRGHDAAALPEFSARRDASKPEDEHPAAGRKAGATRGAVAARRKRQMRRRGVSGSRRRSVRWRGEQCRSFNVDSPVHPEICAHRIPSSNRNHYPYVLS